MFGKLHNTLIIISLNLSTNSTVFGGDEPRQECRPSVCLSFTCDCGEGNVCGHIDLIQVKHRVGIPRAHWPSRYSAASDKNSVGLTVSEIYPSREQGK